MSKGENQLLQPGMSRIGVVDPIGSPLSPQSAALGLEAAGKRPDTQG